MSDTRAGDAMAMLVSATGSTPKRAGAKMWIGADGSIAGTVTIGGCVDARIIDAAAKLSTERPVELLDMDLGDEEAWELGLTCGGQVSVLVARADDAVRAVYDEARALTAAGHPVVVETTLDGPLARRVLTLEKARAEGLSHEETAVFGAKRSSIETIVTDEGRRRVFLEYIAPPRQVVVIGAGEVARSLVPILAELGMETVVVDARDRFASRERFPLATDVRAGIPSEIVAAIPKSSRVAIVLVAHDYKFELPVLRSVLRENVGYIGMLGGKRRGATIRSMLAEEGFDAEELARIHSPIGLDIGAKSTAEIALAIAAELVSLDGGASN